MFLTNVMYLQLTLCKDASGNFDLRVQANSNRVFACLMVKGSSVALAGMSFGDQILQINGAAVAGIAMDEVNALFHKSPDHGNSVVVRDRFVFVVYFLFQYIMAKYLLE
jgi:C-terminal processing protease CtpA/Prc